MLFPCQPVPNFCNCTLRHRIIILVLFYAHLSAQVPQSLSGLNAGFEAPLSSVAFIACLIPELQLLNHGHKSVKSNHSAHQCRMLPEQPDSDASFLCKPN